jgi:hypothetical protein
MAPKLETPIDANNPKAAQDFADRVEGKNGKAPISSLEMFNEVNDLKAKNPDQYRAIVDGAFRIIDKDSKGEPKVNQYLGKLDIIDAKVDPTGAATDRGDFSDRGRFANVSLDGDNHATSVLNPNGGADPEGSLIMGRNGQNWAVTGGKLLSLDGSPEPGGTVTQIADGKVHLSDEATKTLRQFDPATGEEISTTGNSTVHRSQPGGEITQLDVNDKQSPNDVSKQLHLVKDQNGWHNATGKDLPGKINPKDIKGDITFDHDGHPQMHLTGDRTATILPQGVVKVTDDGDKDHKHIEYRQGDKSIWTTNGNDWYAKREGGDTLKVDPPNKEDLGTGEVSARRGNDDFILGGKPAEGRFDGWTGKVTPRRTNH